MEKLGLPPAIFLQVAPLPWFISTGFSPASARYLKSALPAIPPPATTESTLITAVKNNKSPEIIKLEFAVNSFFTFLIKDVSQFFLYSYFSVSTGLPLGT